MKIACLIPARLGSKRLPQKNIRDLNGKPLLFWSIDAALETDFFDFVCVSTESKKICEIVRSNYASSEVETILRPPELATDTASLNDVCIHYLESRPNIEFLSLFMPTYPFRQPVRIIDEIYPALLSRQVDQVVSVRYRNYSTFDYWIKNENKFSRMFTHSALWCGATNATYVFKKREYFFLPPHKWPYRIGERTLRIQTNFDESVDIDTETDFKIAEKICHGYRPKTVPLDPQENKQIEFIAPKGADIKSLTGVLKEKGIKLHLPILVLRQANPPFTFLRWYECNMSRSYSAETTEKILANLPQTGHSQDFPIHYMHSPFYRIFRKDKDREGLRDSVVPASQVIFEEELKEYWPGYIEPIEWILDNE